MSAETRRHAQLNEATAAADMAAFATALRRIAPELDSVSFPLADGHVVLCGPGLYVNHALAVGFDTVPTSTEFDRFEAAAHSRGLPARVEVHEHTRPELPELLRARGYTHEADDRTAGLALALDNSDSVGPEPSGIDVRIVVTPDDLTDWQAATAAGWGHDTPTRRFVSDCFSAAAHATQTPGLLLAHDPDDGRVVGCASLSVRDRVATLGGMSTLPTERGHGVQQALIAQRLQLAREAGCELAVSHADADGGSIRNLHRLGFVTTHTKTVWSRPPGEAG